MYGSLFAPINCAHNKYASQSQWTTYTDSLFPRHCYLVQDLVSNSIVTFFVMIATCLWADGLADAHAYFDQSHNNMPACDLNYGKFRFGTVSEISLLRHVAWFIMRNKEEEPWKEGCCWITRLGKTLAVLRPFMLITRLCVSSHCSFWDLLHWLHCAAKNINCTRRSEDLRKFTSMLEAEWKCGLAWFVQVWEDVNKLICDELTSFCLVYHQVHIDE